MNEGVLHPFPGFFPLGHREAVLPFLPTFLLVVVLFFDAVIRLCAVEDDDIPAIDLARIPFDLALIQVL